MPLSIAEKAISDAHLSHAIPSIFFFFSLLGFVSRFLHAFPHMVHLRESENPTVWVWKADRLNDMLPLRFWFIFIDFFSRAPSLTSKLTEPNWWWKRFANKDRLEMIPGWMRLLVSSWGFIPLLAFPFILTSCFRAFTSMPHTHTCSFTTSAWSCGRRH